MKNMVTMVNVSDMERSVKFYRDILGLKLRYQSPGWSEFEVDASTLGLHSGGKPRAVTQGKREIIAGTASIGFNVVNVDRTYEELEAQGVRFIMEPTSREGEGIRLAVFLDPDGMAISVAQATSQTEHA